MQSPPFQAGFALWVLVWRPRVNGAVHTADSAHNESVRHLAGECKAGDSLPADPACGQLPRRARRQELEIEHLLDCPRAGLGQVQQPGFFFRLVAAAVIGVLKLRRRVGAQ